MISAFLFPTDRFDNIDEIEKRVVDLEPAVAGSLRTTLRYLYLIADGPINLPRDRMLKAIPSLDAAERVLVRWLYTRTNGSERNRYGSAALLAARTQRYRCEHCGHADVRVLTLDHVEGRRNREQFACLCANCHMLKSRERDWVNQPETKSKD